MEHESILIDGYRDANARIKPDQDQIDNLFNHDYVETSEWSHWYTDKNGVLFLWFGKIVARISRLDPALITLLFKIGIAALIIDLKRAFIYTQKCSMLY